MSTRLPDFHHPELLAKEIAFDHTMASTYFDLQGLCERSPASTFAPAGSYVCKRIRGITYWYFQTRCEGRRVQRYVGGDSWNNRERVAVHRELAAEHRARKRLVAALTRSLRVPAPAARLRPVLEAFARADIHRGRQVLVGPLAWQVYEPLLGVRLPRVGPKSAVLGVVTPAETMTGAVPGLEANRIAEGLGLRAFKVALAGGMQLHLITDDRRVMHASFRQSPCLEHLHFLVASTEPAVVLAGAGIQVCVPVPERHAIHRLLVATRALEFEWAGELVRVLWTLKPDRLVAAARDAFALGEKPRERLANIAHAVRDRSSRLALWMLLDCMR